MSVLNRWVPVSWLLVLWDLVIATAVATIATMYLTESVWNPLIGFGMAVTLIARRHAPFPVFVVVTLLAVAQLFVGADVPAIYDVAVLIAMVSVVTHTRSFWQAYAAAGVVSAGLVTVTVDDIGSYADGNAFSYPYIGELLAIWAACASLWLGAYVMRFNRERAVTAERERDHLALLAAADERAFIARELHDVVAHSLAVMIAQADGASYVVTKDPDGAREAMRTVAGTGRDALEDMHRIVAVLRGSASASEPDRRRRGLEELETLVARARTAGVGVDLRVDGETGALSAADELTVYRIVQESLTNVLRHAGQGAKAEVSLRVGGGQAVLEIGDDGAGRPATGVRTGGNGLVGMRERIAVHGGELSAGPQAGSGWRIHAVIPMKEAG
ncbi:sensor histidine kinase [Catenuloplanes japonicus]|uniref:sensor histidine kinase n=1 Tax=Catenuloplanes japonicus TaxID=33876 RepID=UPI0007C5538C|nr:sensor histidine kinase [Catenuloplanes japonicus]